VVTFDFRWVTAMGSLGVVLRYYSRLSRVRSHKKS